MDTPDEDAATGSTEQDDGLTRSEKRLLLGLAGAGAVILVVMLLLNVFGDDSAKDTAGQDDSSDRTDQSDEPAPDPSAFTEGGDIGETPAQLSPIGDPIVDDLDRAGLDGGPLAWEVLGEGGWTPENGRLATDAEPENASPLGVVEAPASFGAKWRFSIVVEVPANNAGFVFGVVDAENYWELKFNADYAAAVVNHVIDGQPAQVKAIAPTALGEGVSWEVQHEGDTVTLAAQGEPFLAMSDQSLKESRKVGVVATSGAPATFSAPQVAPIEGP